MDLARLQQLARASVAGALAALMAAGPALAQEANPQHTTHTDIVEVTRLVVDAYIVDSNGQPVPDLGPENVRVKIGGRRAKVESIEWVTGAVEPEEFKLRETTVEVTERVAVEEAGRLIVFFFQRDLHPSRMVGLMKMAQRAEAILDELDPRDYVAVFCFDSHLRAYTDFTRDRDVIRTILNEKIITVGEPVTLEDGPFPSIGESFDPLAAEDAASPERALWVLGRSLSDIRGPKTMFFFGWGLGRMQGDGAVVQRAEYGTAARALIDARVAVFSLDVTRADYHSLEGPLRSVAHDTGGFYLKTHLFSGLAMERVVKAVQGHYVITIIKPKLRPGRHEMQIRLKDADGTVHARRWVSG